jgi:hypothetical protein
MQSADLCAEYLLNVQEFGDRSKILARPTGLTAGCGVVVQFGAATGRQPPAIAPAAIPADVFGVPRRSVITLLSDIMVPLTPAAVS